MSETYRPSEDSMHATQPERAIDGEVPEVEILNEVISERVRRAANECEFQTTPELTEAINGYYHDHYFLAGAIKATVEGRYNSPVFDAILTDESIGDWEKQIAGRFPTHVRERESGSPNARTAAYRLALMASAMRETGQGKTEENTREFEFSMLRQSGVALQENLFMESSVGISTLGENELRLAQELADRVKEASAGRLIWEVPAGSVSFSSGESIVRQIKQQQEKFWADTRMAGQLEFHGSGSLGGINIHGLMSRNQQLRKTGSMQAQTALRFGGDTMHSVVPHFSEFYGQGEYILGEQGGTIAIPLAKVIDEAPYARDARYTFLQPKTKELIDKIPTPTLERPTGRVGAGDADLTGASGGDRVFFSSPDETATLLPDDYEIDLFDKANKPATYIIDRTTPLHNPSRELHELGHGYGFPERLIIEQGTDTGEQIKDLQEAYLEAYSHRGIVVPLRRGVFAQAFENLDVDQIKGRAAPRIYNRYIDSSERPTTELHR